MSRGGRGGRGGRGRFGGRGSVTQDLIRDNLEDLGIEGAHGIYGSLYAFQQDSRLPPVLYPIIDIPAPNSLSDSDRYLIQKSFHLINRLQSSSKYLKRVSPEDDLDVIGKRIKTQSNLRNELKSQYHNVSKYFPSELLDESSIKVMNRRKKDDLAFTELEKAERSLKEAKDKEKTDGSDDEVAEMDEDDDDDDDYGVDHYASDDNDGDDDGDREAVF